MGVQMFVCPYVSIWRANGNPNPCTDLDQIFTHIPTFPREVSVQVYPAPHPLGLRGLKPYKMKGPYFTKQKMFSRLQINPGSAGYLN